MNKPIMYSKDTYDKLYNEFLISKKGQQIISISLSNNKEWLDVPEEREYLRINLEAIKRGVKLTNIFIIPKHNVFNIINNYAFKKLYSINRKNTKFIIKEELKKRYNDLYNFFDLGCVLFRDEMVFQDANNYDNINFIKNEQILKKYRKKFEELVTKKDIFLNYNQLKQIGIKDNISIRPVEKDSLKKLAKIYKEVYDKLIPELGEKWTEESAYKMLGFWYKTQSDLFLCAYSNKTGEPLGAVVSGIKPWWDGFHLTDAEIFVNIPYQGRGIGTALYREHYRLAIEKYNAMIIDIHTFSREDGYPLKWYLYQKYEVVDNLYIASGNIKDALEQLSKSIK